jgi:hypothetical protein
VCSQARLDPAPTRSYVGTTLLDIGITRLCNCTSVLHRRLARLRKIFPMGLHAFSAAPFDCNGSSDKISLARIGTTQARFNFIAGPGKRTPGCLSAVNTCKLKAFLVPGDEVLMDRMEGPYVCVTFVSERGVATRGLLPRAALQIASPEPPSVQQWHGRWRRDEEAEIVIKSKDDEVEISGAATWRSTVPSVQRGYYETQTGELEGNGKPKGHVLAIGYDPDRSGFPPAEDAVPDICAAKLELYGRYLRVTDNDRCGGMHVTFTGVYVRVTPK